MLFLLSETVNKTVSTLKLFLNSVEGIQVIEDVLNNCSKASLGG